MPRKVAALYVQTNGAYYGLDDVDPWDEKRDARLYAGPDPVVAHPPCARWCKFARTNQTRYGLMVGDDNGCFASALEAVNKYGGVLEHPAQSIAFERFGLGKPKREWSQCGTGWKCEVWQGNYGHRAAKPTWLYVNGVHPSQTDKLDFSTCSTGVSCTPKTGWDRLGKRERSATPLAFRDVLLAMARSVK